MLSQRLATYRQFVNNGIKYFFPSSLHRWYVEWKLWGITDATSFDCADVLELVINVIFYFLSTRILNPTRHRPWRCSTSTGSPISGRILPLLSYLFLFQELARIICRIRHGERPSGFSHPSKKKWGGVELLHDGNQFAQHFGRFSSQTGSYGTPLPLSD